MKLNKCFWLAAAFMVLLGPVGSAQTKNNSRNKVYPNNLTMDSAQPSIDSVYLRQMRTKMARIRSAERRPTVGLVLSGGGAKGAAQVGALKFIEELDIPIDLICGTSIGGLLGGLYAIGYKADELEDIFINQDWDKLLTDVVDQKYIPYSTKMYNSKYVLTIPFQTAIDLLNSGKKNNEEYKRQSFMSSLPSGYAYGFNVNNQISSLTVGYQDDMSFNDLPIPFVCVASDMISCKAKNWGSGSINTALRSTMSIPGLFEPVRTDGMVLIDGGTRNNFPTDIAKAMGADIIIAIELSDMMPGFEEVNNIGDIVSQMISMLGTDAYNKNINLPDVFIKPHIPEFNMLSFNAKAVDTMIVRGYDAAKAKKDELLKVKSRVSRTGSSAKNSSARGASAKRKPDATNIAIHPVRIESIEFRGVTEKESKYLSRMLDFEPGDTVSRASMDEVMSRLQATNSFASITYSLLGKEEPYKLVFNCKTSPTNSVGLGFRIDSEEWASIILNVGLNTNSLMGSRFNLTAKLGQNMKFDAHYSLDLGWMPTINLNASLFKYSGNLGIGTDVLKYGVSYWSHRELLYLTDVRWKRSNFKVGLRNQYNNVDSKTVFGSMITSNLSKDALKGNYFGAFASGNYYSFDNKYYPTRGTSLSFSANYDFIKSGNPGFHPIIALGFDWKTVFRLGEKVALIPDVHLRNIFSTGDLVGSDGQIYNGVSLLHCNFIGGVVPGRYTDSQVPFFGIDNVLLAEEHLATASLELRVNPYKKLFLSALAGFVQSKDKFAEMFGSFDPEFYAMGISAGYNSSVGPLRLDVHWNQVHKWGLYVSFGYDF